MQYNKQIYLLIFVMTIIIIVIESLTLITLYNTTFEKQAEQLEVSARSQATFITTAANFDSHINQNDHDVSYALLTQIHNAYQQYQGFGKTGEFTLGELKNNKINFILRSRQLNFSNEEKAITIDDSNAIPMQRALSGESGHIVAKDYSGKPVLAAYAAIPTLNYGVVVKIDLAEVRAPYIRTAIIIFVITVLLIIAGAFSFRKITLPMIENIKESDSYNRMLFESSPIGLALCSMDGTLLDINHTYANIIGRNIEETKSLTYWEITPKDYANDEALQLEKLNTTGKYGPFEKEYIHRDGHKVEVSLLAQIIELNGEKYIWSSVEDISKRKQAEAILQNAQLQQQLILDSTGEAIYGVDMSGNCTFANPACIKVIGYKNADDLLGKNMHELIHHTHADGSLYPVEKCNIYQAHIQGIHTHADNEVFWRKDGTCFPVEYWSHPIIQDKTIIGSVITFTDISERIASKESIILNEARLNEAQRLAKVGSWELDLLTGELIWSNEIFNMFEIEQSKFKASYEAFLNVIHPDDRERVNTAYTNSLESRQPYEIVHRLKMRDGNIKYVRENCESYFDDTNKPVRSVGTVQDITEIIIAELELTNHREKLEKMVEERTQKLHDAQEELVRKERLATLGQLTATVSHELRNPLGAMRPSLYVIEKKSNKDDERMQNAIRRVDRNIDRCDHIIDELLDFTRITELNLKNTNIDQWLDLVIDEQIITEGIHVEKDLGLKGLELNIDHSLLRRAIINVIENACHAMMDNNQKLVTHKNSHLTIKTITNNKHVEIIISDTGTGIPEEILSKMFEPLFSTKGFGIGLGMPTVKQIVEQHSGGVTVKSEEGKGTSVTLWLPNNIIDKNKQLTSHG